MSQAPLKTIVVGCRGVGANHAKAAAASPNFAIVAGCDLVEEAAEELAAQHEGAKAYTDFQAALEAEKPDCVIIATGNASHAKLAIMAAEAGVKGIFCEKPMSVSHGEAKAMVSACEKAGTRMVVNHQRRTSDLFRTMRGVLESGELGDIEFIRGSSAGDILSDGTHLVDTIRFLNGDRDIEWIFGQIHREIDPNEEKPDTKGVDMAYQGRRFGHAVENGGIALLQFKDGPRAELLCGDMRLRSRPYHDIEIFGTKGRLHAPGDRHEPPLLKQDIYQGGWRAVPIESTRDDANQTGLGRAYLYDLFAASLREGKPHPLDMHSALKNQEAVCAIYESARLRKKLFLPLEQDAFPLQLMIDANQL